MDQRVTSWTILKCHQQTLNTRKYCKSNRTRADFAIVVEFTSVTWTVKHSADKTVTVTSLSILWECSYSVAEETLNFKYCNYTMKRKHKEHMREPTWLQHFHLNVPLFHSSTHCILPLAIQHSSWSAPQQLFLAHHLQMNNNNARDYCSKSVWWGARHTYPNQVQDQVFNPL